MFTVKLCHQWNRDRTTRLVEKIKDRKREERKTEEKKEKKNADS